MGLVRGQSISLWHSTSNKIDTTRSDIHNPKNLKYSGIDGKQRESMKKKMNVLLNISRFVFIYLFRTINNIAG